MSYSCTRAQALIWPFRSHMRPRSRSRQTEISNDKFNLCNELCERDDSEEISAAIVGTKVLLVYAFNCAFHQSWLPFKWHFSVSFQALFLPLSVFHFCRKQMIKWQLPEKRVKMKSDSWATDNDFREMCQNDGSHTRARCKMTAEIG